jgi:hypothetical protein
MHTRNMSKTGTKNMDTKTMLSSEDYDIGDLYDDQALLRKVDWRILPIMFITYFLQFVDKISLNVRRSLYLLVIGLNGLTFT